MLNATLKYEEKNREVTIKNIFNHKNYFTIGRTEGNDDQVLDMGTSRCHCMLLTDSKGVYLVSYALNGTHYNPAEPKFDEKSHIKSVQGHTVESFLAHASQIEAKNEQKKIRLQNIPGYSQGAYKQVSDIQCLIKWALDPVDIHLLTAMGTLVSDGGWIGIGGKQGSARKYHIVINKK